MRALAIVFVLLAASSAFADNIFICDDGTKINLAMFGDGAGVHTTIFINNEQLSPKAENVGWGSIFSAYDSFGRKYYFELNGSKLRVSHGKYLGCPIVNCDYIAQFE